MNCINVLGINGVCQIMHAVAREDCRITELSIGNWRGVDWYVNHPEITESLKKLAKKKSIKCVNLSENSFDRSMFDCVRNDKRFILFEF